MIGYLWTSRGGCDLWLYIYGESKAFIDLISFDCDEHKPECWIVFDQVERDVDGIYNQSA